MGKVRVKYTHQRLPCTLEMPWLSEPLTWDKETGRIIDVDYGDALRLAETSGHDFHIIPDLSAGPDLLPAQTLTQDLEERNLFKCELCGNTYKHLTSLIRHKKDKHGDHNRE